MTVVGSYAVGMTMCAPRLPVAGETVLAGGWDLGPGGKGSNQAVQAARMGASVRLIAAVGSDHFGREAMELWRAERIDTSAVVEVEDLPTGAGFIVVDEAGESRILIHAGANSAMTAEVVDRHRAAFSDCRVVLAQLEAPPEAAVAAVHAAHRVGAVAVLDPAPARPLPPELLGEVDILTPNQTEAQLLLGQDPDSPAEPRRLAGDLLARGARAVVLTLGENGALVATCDGLEHLAAPRVDVVDTTGAGDAFAGTLAAELAAGGELEAAVRRAVVAGALACITLGVVPSLPTREQLAKKLIEVNGAVDAGRAV